MIVLSRYLIRLLRRRVPLTTDDYWIAALIASLLVFGWTVLNAYAH